MKGSSPTSNNRLQADLSVKHWRTEMDEVSHRKFGLLIKESYEEQN